MVSSGELALCFDARVLSEYGEVLSRRKFKFDKDKVAALLDYLEHHGCTVASTPLVSPLPDPDDEAFLEVALTGGAECLVTGNGAHFPQGLRQGAVVVSPREFLLFHRQQR